MATSRALLPTKCCYLLLGMAGAEHLTCIISFSLAQGGINVVARGGLTEDME